LTPDRFRAIDVMSGHAQKKEIHLMANDVNKRVFTIDSKNNSIVQLGEGKLSEGKTAFRTEKEFAALTASWPVARFVHIWNQIPGNTPIKKFTDCKTAIRRLWLFVQSLTPDTRIHPLAQRLAGRAMAGLNCFRRRRQPNRKSCWRCFGSQVARH
jgi:hypothetical protein